MASLIIVTGTTWDAARLDLAKRLGADEGDHAIRAVARETGEDAIHISLLPGGEGVTIVARNPLRTDQVLVEGLRSVRPE